MVSAVHLHGCCGPEPPGGPAVPMWGQEMEGGANCQGQGLPALCGLSHREGVLGDRSLHAEHFRSGAGGRGHFCDSHCSNSSVLQVMKCTSNMFLER